MGSGGPHRGLETGPVDFIEVLSPDPPARQFFGGPARPLFWRDRRADAFYRPVVRISAPSLALFASDESLFLPAQVVIPPARPLSWREPAPFPDLCNRRSPVLLGLALPPPDAEVKQPPFPIVVSH